MNEVQGVIDVAKGVSDVGATIMICAAFIVLSLLMWIAIFRWFKSIIDNMMTKNSKVMDDLLATTNTQNDLLNDIADGMRPTTLLQIKSQRKRQKHPCGVFEICFLRIYRRQEERACRKR